MVEPEKSYLVRILRWSEKYTKTDMVYFASGGFWSLVGQTSAIVSSFALAIVVSRFVPKETYGDYKYILSIIALLSTFTLTGLGGAMFQSVAHGFDGALPEAFWTNIRWSILLFLGAFGVAGYYFFFHNYELAFGMLLGGCLSPFFASANFTQSFLGAKKDFARSTLYFDVIANFIPALCLIASIFIYKDTLVLIVVYFVSNTFVALYFYSRTLRLYNIDRQNVDKGTLLYGKHLSAISILGGIANNIDQILLFHYVGAAQLAIYNFATAIPDQSKGPLKMLDAMTQAKFARRDNTEIRSGMRHKLVIFFLTNIVLIALYILLAPFVFKLFFPNYVPAIFYSQIYAVSLLLSSMGPITSYLAIKKKIKEQYIINIVSAVFQIFAIVVGVVMWGLMGLILARVASRTFMALLTYLLYKVTTE